MSGKEDETSTENVDLKATEGTKPSDGKEMSAKDDATKIKKQRGIWKGMVTKQINTVFQYMAEDDYTEVRNRLEALKSAFKKFSSLHERYIEYVVDDIDIEENDEYFETVQMKYVDALNKAKDWLKNCDRSTDVKYSENNPESNHVGEQMRNIVDVINLPKVELTMFDGNPLKYHTFVATFDETVDKVCVTNRQKLTRLLQYTTGRAHEAIESCILIDGERGYDCARELLHRRFGDDYLVSERLVQNVLNGKNVISADELQQLSDELNNCMITLSQMGRLQEVDNHQAIVKILGRLQQFRVNRFKRIAEDIKENESRYPNFKELAKFVTKEATAASCPVYGKLGSGANDGSKSKPKSSFAVGTGSSFKPYKYKCVLCAAGHKLLYCDKFRTLKLGERLELVRKHKLCENCLLGNHATAECRKTTVCTVEGCGERHTKFLHKDKNVHLNRDFGASSSTPGVRVVNANVSVNSEAHMPVVAVSVNGKRDVCALLDTGSSQSFCTESLLKMLGIQGAPVMYSVDTLTGSVEDVSSKAVKLTLTSLDGLEVLNVINVFVVDRIPVITTCPDTSLFSQFKGLQIVDSGQEVHLLIGQDNSEALVPLEVRRGNKGEPFACRTLFGWSCNGPGNGSRTVSSRVQSNFISSKSIESDVCKLWDIENLGLSQDKLSWSQVDRKVIEFWDSKVELIDGHYVIPIPWKEGVKLDNNIAVAMARLKSLKLNLDKRGLMQKYDDEVRKLLDNGYAEVIPENEITFSSVWYLPHQGVVNDKKPGKLRIVFDCASKFHGESLNDKCRQGPDLVNPLRHVLFRFRQHEYCVMGDVEAMYHQVRVPPQDKDALRFLWYGPSGQIKHFRMKCHIFGGVWCACSSTYALRCTVVDNPSTDSLVVDTVLRSFYVDDCLRSLESVTDALNVIDGVKDVLSKGGFKLTKFASNRKEVIDHVPVSDRVKELFQESSAHRVLGVRWDVVTDELYFDIDVNVVQNVNRRSMLRTIASMYDPLGLINPMIVTGKLLFQNATQQKLSWDEVVPDDLREKWIIWLTELRNVSKLRIPRCIKPGIFNDAALELHHFCDSSKFAYGCCCYLRCINKDGKLHTTLLASKCRVAPLKYVSIPRLELQGAVLAAQLDAVMREQLDLPLGESYFWIDNKVALCYIQNETLRFQVFVANRVATICGLTHPSQWAHVPGLINPADLLTRGKSMDNLDLQRWYQGPEFLRQYKSQWKISSVKLDLFDDDPELIKEVRAMVTVAEQSSPIDMLVLHYSDWYRLKRAVGWLLRFVSIIKLGKDQACSGCLSVSELQVAELAVIRHVQRKHYPREFKELSSGGCLPGSSSVKDLCPFMDDQGVLRVGGRLGHANLPEIVKHPYLIPHDSPIARLIAREHHNIAHLGVEWVVSSIRQKYWLTKVRCQVKSVSRDCVSCKKLFAQPGYQYMSDLPHARVDVGLPPFHHTGVDCFGPFVVKRGRSEVKRYGCLFTCMGIRAIHLEKIDSLDTDSFLNAFRRFCARRGCPKVVFSDNGTNLVSGSRVLIKSMEQVDQEAVDKFCVREGIEWKFIPPNAPHMGGVWERVVRIVKKVMTGLIGSQTFPSMTDEMLETLFCEVECIVNGRPLTRISNDIKDEAAITPNHILMIRQTISVTPGSFNDADLYRKRWRAVQHVVDCFWRRWMREYLPELQRRSKWIAKQRNLKNGDIVLIVSENTPRGVWPMGIISEVFPSNDGLVRSAKVKTRSSTFIRPVVKLVLLECSQ